MKKNETEKGVESKRTYMGTWGDTGEIINLIPSIIFIKDTQWLPSIPPKDLWVRHTGKQH